MSKYDLTEFVRIEEVDTFVVAYAEVNEYLKAGWLLFATRTEAHDEPEGQTQSTVYCLGWPWKLGESPLNPEDIENMSNEEIKDELEERLMESTRRTIRGD